MRLDIEQSSIRHQKKHSIVIYIKKYLNLNITRINKKFKFNENLVPCFKELTILFWLALNLNYFYLFSDLINK